MRSRWVLALAVVAMAATSACHRSVATQIEMPLLVQYMPPRAEGTTLRVASFNILYAGNSAHPWAERHNAVADCVRDMAPDVFGVQEAEWSQLEDLLEALPGYACVGRARDDGRREGEFSTVFYLSNRFVLLDTETFWLSDTPETPGSNTWDAACNRVATVAVLQDRLDGRPLGVCNTHLDHVSAKARENGSALIRRRLPSYGKGLAWVVTGDFNATPGSKPHTNLVGEDGLTLVDTFATVHPKAPADISSHHGYKAEPSVGRRIDWVLASPQFEPLAGDVNQFKYRGIYPSDHFPVWADLRR